MADASDLSELQLAIMQVLWRWKEASAAEVQAALPDRELAITTVSTLLTRLEKRGIVAHRSEGRLFIYMPTVQEPEVKRSMVSALLDSLFAGDASALVQQLIDSKELRAGDLDRMRALIRDRKRKGGRA